MGTSNFSDEFKRDAVQQIRVRGYPDREVSRRLGVSSHSFFQMDHAVRGGFAEAERH
jgi:transposase